MMAGNPNWWSMNSMHSQQSSNQLSNSSSVYGSSISSNPSQADEDHHHHDHHPNQDFPVRSWSQLLMGGMGGNNEEERFSSSLFQQQKKIENWEEQVFLNLNPSFTTRVNHVAVSDVKQEDDVIQSNNNTSCQLYNSHLDHDEFQSVNTHSTCNWPPINHHHHHHHHHHQVGSIPVSSPTSCITTLGNNFLNFSGGKAVVERKNNQHNQDHSAESNNSTGTGGVSKKARVQHSSAQPALKVRKEKLGDRITALHQLVSPFGKTDTASVLSEAIGYIGFLQGQIEALSSPYMRNAPGNTGHHQHSVQERNCLFPEEPTQDSQSRGVKDLRSRGLCLVPISCTQHVANDNGADYWAPAALGGGF